MNDILLSEYHIHIEGCVSPETLIKLSEKYKYSLDIEKLILKRGAGLKNFFYNFGRTLDLYRTEEDFRLLAEGFIHYLFRNSIAKAYAFISPGNFNKRGAPQKIKTEMILAALTAVFKKYDDKVKIFLVFDADRGEGFDHCRDVAYQAVKFRKRVRAFSLGGPEPLNLDLRFVEVYHYCRRFGLETFIHAGESRYAKYLKEAIENLPLNRVAHATALRFAPELAAYIKEKNITIDLCPTSNYLVGIIDTFQDLPVDILRKNKISFTINSDDPFFFNTSLQRELDLYNKFFL